MRLSPLELRKHQFAKRFRFKGYDPDEVNGFVRQMADQWAELLEDNRRLEERNNELAGKLTHYEKVELALQEALETARHTARQIEDNSERKAKLTVEEAELRAQRMLQDAEQERYTIKRDLINLNSRQSEIAARMRAFLMAEMEVLAQYQGDDPIGFIRLVSAQESGAAGLLPEPVAQLAASNEDVPKEATPSVAKEDEGVDDALPVSMEEAEQPTESVTTPAESQAVEEAVSTFEPPAVEEPVSIADPPPANESEVAIKPQAVEEPVSAIEPPVAEERVSTLEPPAIEEPTVTVEPPPAPSAEPSASEPAIASETVEASYSESPSATPPAAPPPLPVKEAPPPVPEPVSPFEPPAPVRPPVEEAAIPAPKMEPTVLPSVEELVAQTPPPPPPVPAAAVDAEADARPTYRDMLSGTQSGNPGNPSVPPAETQSDPFSSSFFESPFLGGEKPAEADSPEPVPGSDSAQKWSLRSLVTGDGDTEATPTSPSDAERERIRRILEDLD